ncbi:MAG: RNA methyltransferase [Gemmatimonadaceae bacterium]|nr:RNA methyltransferase [Gemmatimonadaceae bacterium]
MKLLTLARDLQRRKARERQGCFVAEGVRSVEALLASPLSIVGLLVTDDVAEDPRGAELLVVAEGLRVPVKVVTRADLESAASTESPQGVLAIGEIPELPLEAPAGPTARYLLLDAIQDPGNVGTIVRTAAALGVTATIALPGTVDLWNAKVVRSSMGALFVHPVPAATWEEVTAFLDAHDIACWAADADGLVIDSSEVLRRDALPARLALVVSNEGAGLSAQAASCASRRVAIGMASNVESLNVAVATGILLHALRPG